MYLSASEYNDIKMKVFRIHTNWNDMTEFIS